MELTAKVTWLTHAGEEFKVGDKVRLVDDIYEEFEGVITCLDEDTLWLETEDDSYDFSIEEIDEMELLA
ncbi:MAG: hypothetical protein E6590_16715 [Clostridiales bacterium]|nr:hypothetical protein [Clostridiales bacterium]